VSARRPATGLRDRVQRAGRSTRLGAGVLLTSSLVLAQPEPEEPAPPSDAPSEDAPTEEAPSEAPEGEVFDADAPEAEAAEDTAPPAPAAPASAAPAPAATGTVVAGTETTSMEIGTDSVEARRRPNDYTSQHFAMELRFGPYRPNVDDNLSVPVYDAFFGDKTRFMMGFEFDWQVWRAPHVGTIGVGLGWGYTQVSGANKVPEGAPAPDNDVPVTQESTLNIMPFYAVAVARIDVLSRDLHIPLVPYGKFGFSYARWWVKNGIGLAQSDPPDPNDPNAAAQRPGKDASTGTQAALGIMLQLDWLERHAAVTLDNETSINNSFLFFEWSASDYPGDQMDVGSSNWVTGLAVEL
jgi:hypothetical protein